MPGGAHIPGQTPLEPDDVRGLRDRNIRTREALNLAEASNIASAVVKYLGGRLTARAAPFDVEWMRLLHWEMFGRVWTWAGELRTRDTSIGVAPWEIGPGLHNLELDLRAWKASAVGFVEQGARLHHRAVFVHPFPNGNGRWSRLLANVWLHLHRQPIVLWPEATVGSASVIRDEYVRAVRAGDRGDRGDLGILIAMHAKYARAVVGEGPA